MKKKLWLVRKLGDLGTALIEDTDYVVLIQDGVLRAPKKNWLVCKEDALARNIKYPQDILVSYEKIAELIESSDEVIIW